MLSDRKRQLLQSAMERREIPEILEILSHIHEEDNEYQEVEKPKVKVTEKPKIKVMNIIELNKTLDKIIYGKALTNEDRINAKVMKSLLRDLENSNTEKSRQSEKLDEKNAMERLAELHRISEENEVAELLEKKALNIELPENLCFTIDNRNYKGIKLKDIEEQNLLISSKYKGLRDIAYDAIVDAIKEEPINAIICPSATNCQGEDRMNMVNAIMNSDPDLIVLNDVTYRDIDIVYAIMRSEVPLILLSNPSSDEDLHDIIEDISDVPLIMSNINSIYF